MRYEIYERPLMRQPDYTCMAFESDSIALAIAFCEAWRDDLTFVIVDTKTGESRQWYDWED